jgi:hypothetical protein
VLRALDGLSAAHCVRLSTRSEFSEWDPQPAQQHFAQSTSNAAANDNDYPEPHTPMGAALSDDDDADEDAGEVDALMDGEEEKEEEEEEEEGLQVGWPSVNTRRPCLGWGLGRGWVGPNPNPSPNPNPNPNLSPSACGYTLHARVRNIGLPRNCWLATAPVCDTLLRSRVANRVHSFAGRSKWAPCGRRRGDRFATP